MTVDLGLACNLWLVTEQTWLLLAQPGILYEAVRWCVPAQATTAGPGRSAAGKNPAT